MAHIAGSWENVHLYCGCHDEEVEMVLKHYSYPEDQKDLMDKLYNAIENIDVDTVTQIVADLVG